MRTPITYYGGKQQLADTIVKLIPPHRVYVEPFIGGAAVFFAKTPSECEIINDINSEIVNFYEVVQRDFPALQSEINISLTRKNGQCQYGIGDQPLINLPSFTGRNEFPYDQPFTQNYLQALDRLRSDDPF